MNKDFKTLENVIRLPHKYAAGPVYTRFYAGLKDEKLLGTRCEACGKVFVPARSFCPQCGGKEAVWTEVDPQGELVSWTWTDQPYFGAPLKPPVVTALIRLDGTDCDFLHLLGGLETTDIEELRRNLPRGTRVKAVWREDKQGRMLDIEYFTPVT